MNYFIIIKIAAFIFLVFLLYMMYKPDAKLLQLALQIVLAFAMLAITVLLGWSVLGILLS